MRISDWSSDVCSSDLSGRRCPAAGAAHSFAPPIRWERRASGQVRGVWSSNSYSMQSDSAPKRDIRIIPDGDRAGGVLAKRERDACRETDDEIGPAAHS